jgi:general secretion pathway protein K
LPWNSIHSPKSRFEGEGRGGSALVLVIWTVALLSLMVACMSFDAQLESQIISCSRKRLKAEYLARAGVEVAEMLMVKGEEIRAKGDNAVKEEDDQWFDAAQQLAMGGKVSGLAAKLGDGEIILDILPEPARRNVNLLGVDDWERVLDVAGIPEELWPTLIDSALDWIDVDEKPRHDGAETDDYYATLNPPYRSRNAPLDDVDDLLKVKGFSNAILFGGVLNSGKTGEEQTPVSGIKDMLTTYGDGKVNVNAAPERVLMTLPGVDDIVAGAIIEEREGRGEKLVAGKDKSFKSVPDFLARIPGLDPKINGYVVTASYIYRITSVGDVGGTRRKIARVGVYAGKRFNVWRAWEED